MATATSHTGLTGEIAAIRQKLEHLENLNQVVLDGSAFREALFQNSPAAVLAIGYTGQVVKANTSACILFGRNEDQLRALPCQDLFFWDQLVAVPDFISSFSGELVLAVGPSAQTSAYMYIAPLSVPDQEVVACLLVAPAMANTDVPTNPITEKRLLLEKIRGTIWQAPNLKEGLSSALALVCTFTHTSYGEVWLFDEYNDELRHAAHWHPPGTPYPDLVPEPKNSRSKKGQGFPGLCWQSEKVIFSNDLHREKEFRRKLGLSNTNLKAGLFFPIKHHDHLVAVFGLVAEQIPEEKEDLLDFLVLLSQQLGAEIKQKKAAEELEWIFEYSPEIFCVVGFDGLVRKVNKASETLLGYQRKEIIGKPFQDFKHPDDPPSLDLELFYAEPKNKPTSVERRLRCKDGTYKWFSWTEVTAYPFEFGLFVNLRDITERKKTEDRLTKLALAVNRTPNSIFITNQSNQITWANDKFLLHYGYTIEKVLGKRPNELVSGQGVDPGITERIVQKVNAQIPFSMELLTADRLGDARWINLSVGPIFDDQGNCIGYINIETDIHERVAAEQERLSLNQELERQNRHLEQFAYIISHNLRAPVANLMGLTKMFQLYADDLPLSHSIAENIGKTTYHLDTIIKDLSQILTIRHEINDYRSEIVFDEVLEKIKDSIQQQIMESNALIISDFSEEPSVVSVRSYVHSILQNLLTNALKYRSPKRRLEIQVCTETSGDYICILVKDNGLGIDLNKEKERIFGLYKRFHSHIEGKGLGLYLIKTQAESLGGRVEVESLVEVGTTFRVYIRK